MKTNFKVGMQSWFLQQFLDEGIEQSLENMISHGGVNMLLLATHIDFQTTKNWGRLTHAKREFFECSGFNFDIDFSFYKDSLIKPIKSQIPELAKRDLFGEIATAAKEKGMRVFALIVHRFPQVECYQDLNMRAVNGEPVPAVLCHNHPEIHNFYLCMINHLDRCYDLDGFCYALLDHYSLFGFQTLTDELADTLGIQRFANPEMGLSCFCPTCCQLAEEIGIDVGAIRKGLLKGIKLGYIPHRVEKMTTADQAIRFLLQVPQYLEWLRFRSSGLTQLHEKLYNAVHKCSNDYEVGLDIYGAKDDWKYQTQFQDLAKNSDWIKPMFYSCVYEEPLGPKEIGDGIRLAKELSGKPIFPGINCLPSEPAEKIEAGINHSIENNAAGIVLSWDYSLIPFEYMQVAKKVLMEKNII